MKEKKVKIIDKTTFKFLAVGALNTLVGTGVMFLLYNVAHCSYWVSSAANYIVGGVLSYFLNKYYTFQNKKKSWKQVIKFIFTIAICYFIGYGVAKPLVQLILSNQEKSLQENIAMVVGMGIYVCLNYLGQKFFAFKDD